MFTTIGFIVGLVVGFFVARKLEDISTFATNILSKFKRKK